jgi:hypothetical protein
VGQEEIEVMRTPHFLKLAQVDDQHFITGCRNGIIHLTWGRATTRFGTEEFRWLADVLGRAAGAMSPASIRDGELRVTYRPEDDCEVQVGPLILLLCPPEFQEFLKAVQEAVARLDEILASGVWAKREPEDTPPGFLEQLRRIPFSRN